MTSSVIYVDTKDIYRLHASGFVVVFNVPYRTEPYNLKLIPALTN